MGKATVLSRVWETGTLTCWGGNWTEGNCQQLRKLQTHKLFNSVIAPVEIYPMNMLTSKMTYVQGYPRQCCYNSEGCTT
jgi:hypothetical protein